MAKSLKLNSRWGGSRTGCAGKCIPGASRALVWVGRGGIWAMLKKQSRHALAKESQEVPQSGPTPLVKPGWSEVWEWKTHSVGQMCIQRLGSTKHTTALIAMCRGSDSSSDSKALHPEPSSHLPRRHGLTPRAKASRLMNDLKPNALGSSTPWSMCALGCAAPWVLRIVLPTGNACVCVCVLPGPSNGCPMKIPV